MEISETTRIPGHPVTIGRVLSLAQWAQRPAVR
jgi:hypothetical protein